MTDIARTAGRHMPAVSGDTRMPASGSLLSVRQARFLAALMTHDSISAAAHAAGIAETTAHAWLKLKPFEVHYARARKEIVRHALAQVQQLTSKAVKTLKHLMDAESANVQAYAARNVLDIALRAVTYDDHEQRLRVLEEETYAGPARHAS